MMEAQPITLPRSAVALETRRGELDPQKDLYVDSSAFVSACGCSPSGAAGGMQATADSRYRVLLTVEDWAGLCGIYYVTGWLDEGLCGLAPETVLTRREAIRLKKHGYLSREGVDTACYENRTDPTQTEHPANGGRGHSLVSRLITSLRSISPRG